MLETAGNVSKAMKLAGYSAKSAKDPQRLIKSKGWGELMERYFPDELLTRQHRKLLTKREFIAVGKHGDRQFEPTGEVDPGAVARGLDLAYKLKNKYPATKHEVEGSIAVVKVIHYGEEKNEIIEAETA